jgi:hypothetical protein
MDRRAFVIIGFCPLIVVKSRVAPSMARLLVKASPIPIFNTIFPIRGTRIGLVNPNSCIIAGTISFR